MIEIPSQDSYNGTDFVLYLTLLTVDHFYLIYKNNNPYSVALSVLNEECHNCDFRNHLNISANEEYYIRGQSKFSEIWKVSDADQNEICQFRPHVQEFGVYKLEINKTTCYLETLVKPVNIDLSILSVILIFVSISVPILALIRYWNQRKKNDDKNEQKKRRITCLDTFRGICITFMILVNYGGGGYTFLEHAVWNGLTVADVIFPSFLWIMGVCIPISIKSAVRNSDKSAFQHIIKRSIILFLLGLIVNKFSVSIDYLRIFGVLQRFGLCYFAVASICLLFMKSDYSKTPGLFQDIKLMIPQWICAIVLIGIHSGLTFGLPVENCPETGYLGPGGWQGNKDKTDFTYYTNCSGGAAGYIDRLILTEKHMYNGGIFRQIYNSELPVDPEGILGTLTSIVQVFFGVQAGVTLLTYKESKSRIIRWICWGIATGLIGGGLCGFSKEDGIIPVNKILWSLSFVLVTTCFAFLLLSVLYVIIDEKSWWSGKPFLFAGMNSILLYMGQSLTYNSFPLQWGYVKPNLHFQALSHAVWGTMCWWLVAYWLYKIKFFLSI